MSDNYDYQGPGQVYKPAIDNVAKKQKKPTPMLSPGGYHDMKELQRGLKLVKDRSGLVFDICSKQLSQFSIKVDTSNPALVEAHDLVYPADDTPGYITFDEYKYLMTATDSNQIQYLKKYYEKEMRGPSGTVALDCLNLCRAIHLEVERITNFIDKYIGELNETAEFRTVELFQDWAETALSSLQKLQAAVETPITKGLPRAELAKISPDVSAGYQAFLQGKLNILNKFISDFMESFEKMWNGTSDYFYDSILGPGLLFQVKVASTLTDPVNVDSSRFPTLVAELKGGIGGLSKNYDQALTDQLKRNKIFSQYIRGVLENYVQRDYYKVCIRQLGHTGKTPVNNFVDSSTVNQAEAISNAPDPLTTPTSNLSSSTGLRPSHYDLVDREKDDAHPQYLLKLGGELEGNLTLKSGAKVDGIVPSAHKHTGTDGSAKISGYDLEYGTIGDDNVSSDASTEVPTNIQVERVTGTLMTRVNVEVRFDVSASANIVNYEFEYSKIT